MSKRLALAISRHPRDPETMLRAILDIVETEDHFAELGESLWLASKNEEDPVKKADLVFRARTLKSASTSIRRVLQHHFEKGPKS